MFAKQIKVCTVPQRKLNIVNIRALETINVGHYATIIRSSSKTVECDLNTC